MGSVAEVLTGPDKWTKGASAIDINGIRTNAASGEAVCWCMVGAIDKAYNWRLQGITNAEYVECFNIAANAIAKTFPDVPCISMWNDDKTRTWEDIEKVIPDVDRAVQEYLAYLKERNRP